MADERQLPKPRACIFDVAPYIPGRSKAESISDVYKLSSNESPFGPSPKAVEAYHQAARDIGRYPNGSADAVREALSKKFAIEPERIVCGTGIDNLLDVITRVFLEKGDEAIATQYGFNMFPIYIRASGATLVEAPERNYCADVDAILARISERTKVIILANPNNPTGAYLPGSEIRRLHAGLPSSCLFVLDEAYAEYIVSEKPCGLELARKAQNILVLRTFSKVYGLAGLRLGWAYGPLEIINFLHRARNVFNVSVPAAAAAVAALGDQAHIDKSVAHNNRWREWLAHELLGLGLKITPSETNFLLVHFPAGTAHNAEAADAYLLSKGYILRPLRPYDLPDALRLTIGTEAENKAVAKHLRDFLKQEMAA